MHRHGLSCHLVNHATTHLLYTQTSQDKNTRLLLAGRFFQIDLAHVAADEFIHCVWFNEDRSVSA